MLAKRLTAAVKGQAEPLFIFEEQVIPAASLYMTVRVWEDAFRQAGLQAGERLVVRAVPSVAYVAVLLAALRQGYVFCPLREQASWDEAARYRPRLILLLDEAEIDNAGLPRRELNLLPVSDKFAPTPGVAMILATSGSSGAPKLVALSADNILSVLESHLPLLDLAGKHVLSVLPWHHAFGLILELLGGILGKVAMFVRPPEGGRDVAAALRLGIDYSCNALFAVPLFLERLFEQESGSDFVARIGTGIVGGAPVSRCLSEKLAGSKLRIGYGQTEAAPGITLGRPGFFAPGYVGEAVGCEIRLKKNRLQFRGRNACVGIFHEGGMYCLPGNSWRDTGDIFTIHEHGLLYLGRMDGMIKLPNGRKFNAALAEAIVRERFPEIENMLLWPKQGKGLIALYSVSRDKKIDEVHLRHTLAEIVPVEVRLILCSAEIFRRDPKGGLLRWQTWLEFQKVQHVL